MRELTTATERLASALVESKAPATRRTYRTAWRQWAAWCDAAGHDPHPARGESLALYLAARAAAGASMATLRMACAAVAEAHRLTESDNPCASAVVRTAMQGLSRQLAGRSIRQAAPLTAEAVATVRAHLAPRLGGDPSAARDMSSVRLMACRGLGRSGAAALGWGDIGGLDGDGPGRLSVRRSKTDQTGEGAVVAVTAEAMDDLRRLPRGSADDRVIGIADQQISRRIAATCKAAGLEGRYSGHSGRVGMAVTMTRNQAPMQVTMNQGRWASPRMVAHYARGERADEAGRYL